jgi:hypothetical protein
MAGDEIPIPKWTRLTPLENLKPETLNAPSHFVIDLTARQ